MNVKSTAAMNVQSSAVMSIQSSAVMSVASSAAVNITAGGVLNVTAPLANFSGVIKATAVQAELISGVTSHPAWGT